MSAYRIIQPPFTLRFREMSSADLKAYFRWFGSMIPERIEELGKTINETPATGAWQTDRLPSSLPPLGHWFATHVEIRPRTDQELQEIRANTTLPFDIPNEELTNRTFSLATDAGMYFGEVLIKQCSWLRWEQMMVDRNHADYGQPVIVGLGPVALNPVRILITLAYAVAAGRQDGSRLSELYQYWLSRAVEHQEGCP